MPTIPTDPEIVLAQDWKRVALAAAHGHSAAHDHMTALRVHVVAALRDAHAALVTGNPARARDILSRALDNVPEG